MSIVWTLSILTFFISEIAYSNTSACAQAVGGDPAAAIAEFQERARIGIDLDGKEPGRFPLDALKIALAQLHRDFPGRPLLLRSIRFPYKPPKFDRERNNFPRVDSDDLLVVGYDTTTEGIYQLLLLYYLGSPTSKSRAARIAYFEELARETPPLGLEPIPLTFYAELGVQLGISGARPVTERPDNHGYLLRLRHELDRFGSRLLSERLVTSPFAQKLSGAIWRATTDGLRIPRFFHLEGAGIFDKTNTPKASETGIRVWLRNSEEEIYQAIEEYSRLVEATAA